MMFQTFRSKRMAAIYHIKSLSNTHFNVTCPKRKQTNGIWNFIKKVLFVQDLQTTDVLLWKIFNDFRKFQLYT